MHALLVLTAAFAVASDAIMIPSTISLPAVSPSWQALDLGRLLNPGFSSRLVKLDCPDCSVPLSDSHIDHEKSTSLILDFTISSSGTSLLLNQSPFYPLSALPDDIYAYQASSDTSTEDLRTSFHEVTTTQRRMYYIAGARRISAADGSDAQVIDIDLQITGLAEQDISVDKISLRLLRADNDVAAGADGRLTIIDVITVPSTRGGKAVSYEETLHPALALQAEKPATTECAGMMSLWCKWRPVVESKITALAKLGDKPRCHGYQLPGVRGQGGLHTFARLGHGHFHPQSPRHGPHRFDHHGRHGSHLRHRASDFLATLILPVFIGIAAGVTAGLVGMLVGAAMAWTWLRFVRASQKIRSTGTEEEAIEGIEVSEKEDFLAHQADVEPPPVYVEKA